MPESATIKPSEVRTGKVKFYSDERGYGFVIPDDEGADLFFHIRAVVAGFYPQTGDRVSFVEIKDRAGRRCADKVAGSR
jgi:CspA family cold shock protein